MHARGVLDSSHRTSLHRASTQNLEREESALRADTQFNECTAEERKAVSPLFPSHHSSSVHRTSMWRSTQPHPQLPCFTANLPCCHLGSVREGDNEP